MVKYSFSVSMMRRKKFPLSSQDKTNDRDSSAGLINLLVYGRISLLASHFLRQDGRSKTSRYNMSQFMFIFSGTIIAPNGSTKEPALAQLMVLINTPIQHSTCGQALHLCHPLYITAIITPVNV